MFEWLDSIDLSRAILYMVGFALGILATLIGYAQGLIHGKLRGSCDKPSIHEREIKFREGEPNWFFHGSVMYLHDDTPGLRKLRIFDISDKGDPKIIGFLDLESHEITTK